MKICLIILGQTLTTFTMCSMVERLGFRINWSAGGMHAYQSISDNPLEIVVLDMESKEARNGFLEKKLDTLSQNMDALMLFCNETEDLEELDRILGKGQREKWQIRPFNLNRFSENICSDTSIISRDVKSLDNRLNAFSNFT